LVSSAVPDERAQRDWDFKQLRWSLQALANAGSSQRALFPDLNAEELAREFDHRASAVRSHHESDLTRIQADSLAAVDQKLAIISRDGAEFDVELWTDEALNSSEHWADVRRLAASALEAFGWALESPSAEPEDRGAMSFGE
jgi:uncharacterized protein involved in type VI secretion and phage assembly